MHMLYSQRMNKALVRILFPVLIVATGLAFAMALSPSVAGHADTTSHQPYSSAVTQASARHLSVPKQPATPTPTPEPVSRPGSTDGIVIMSFTIALIIVFPILLQRDLWMK